MSAPIDLNLVRAFIAVHETRSFSAASVRLGVPRSTTSRAIAALEQRLGLELFRRTTRSVATTDEGVVLYDRLAGELGRIDAALADVPERGEVPTGTLRITTIPDLAATVLVDAVARFTARWPAVEVDLRLTSDLVDLARDNIDLAVRLLVKPPRDSALVATKVGTVQVQLFAAPAYLARCGVPRTPEDLRAHDIVTFRGTRVLQPVRGWASAPPARRHIGCDDMRFGAALVRSGAGIGTLPSFLAAQDLVDGTLVPVMPRFVINTAAVYVVRPQRKHVPSRVRLFRDVLVALFARQPLSPP
jgi:DNA-binding transcriptional LysR family regulator